MSVESIGVLDLGNIPEGLRALAGMVENDELSGISSPVETMIWVGVDTDGNLCAGCYGNNTNRYELGGVLHAAATKLMRREF
jgi:hypothetical protein